MTEASMPSAADRHRVAIALHEDATTRATAAAAAVQLAELARQRAIGAAGRGEGGVSAVVAADKALDKAKISAEIANASVAVARLEVERAEITHLIAQQDALATEFEAGRADAAGAVKELLFHLGAARSALDRVSNAASDLSFTQNRSACRRSFDDQRHAAGARAK
jgi:hypothetical protein